MNNIQPQSIPATLPTLGTHNINFYKESAEVLEFLGKKELDRLSRINHLGTASFVFTGVNHSRLEYTLLQCAIISLLPKFNLGIEEFSVKNKVKLSGRTDKVSSGEELLKCWSLLSNSGHAQYTYGSERALLTYAKENSNFCKLLIDKVKQTELKHWCSQVITNYQDNNIHWLLAIIKISSIQPRKRNKQRFNAYIKNLLLPIDNLVFESFSDKCKIVKLRNIFEIIRLLSIVTLDSYYSHQPMRWDISPIIMDIGNLLSQENHKFKQLLIQTASWLAEEIYMHPKAIATMCSYETRSLRKIIRRDEKSLFSSQFNQQMSDFMANGFGQPRNGGICHFLRITLPLRRFRVFQNRDIYSIKVELEELICVIRHTQVYITKNPFSPYLYCDIFIDENRSSLQDIGELCSKIYLWSAKLFESQVNLSLQNFPLQGFSNERLIRFKNNRLNREFDLSKKMITKLFDSVVQYLLPEQTRINICDFIPDGQLDSPLLAKFCFPSGLECNEIIFKLKQIIYSNPDNLCKDRIHELKTLLKVVTYSRASFLIVCAEKLVIRDKNGNNLREWDGVVLEIFENKTRLVIVEAKNKRTSTQNENEAFKQLEQTQKLLHTKRACKTNRKRITGMGAKLIVTLSEKNKL